MPMIKVKNVFEGVEASDGTRLWVEPIDLTKDLRKWCEVDHVLSHIGPPMDLWEWFEAHPGGYEYFRATYHEHLNKGKYRPALKELAAAGTKQTITLLHQTEDPEHNTAMALYEYLSELGSYCPPDVPET
jgi:uncharacterized protein YeaO (DUF488 family)